MIPAEIKKLCDELGIRIHQFSTHHYRLNIEEKGLYDYWPTVKKIGPIKAPAIQPKHDICDYILSEWCRPANAIEVRKWYAYMNPEETKLPTRMKDTSLMPFGKHKGKALANVPNDYLLWLWDNFNAKDR